MSLTKFTENTNIISELPDEPTQTSSELKAKFDEAGTKIKNYLNNTLTTETEQLVATEKTTLQTLIANLRTDLNTAINDLRTEMQNYANAQILADNKVKYPIGKIIMSATNINPSTYLGFGTWQLWGQGRVPVGVDESDTDFNTVEKTGGEKTHTLTLNEIPSHKHTIGSNLSLWTQQSGYGNVNTSSTSGANRANIMWGETNNSGGGRAHNIMQPYITCYMWKRVS